MKSAEIKDISIKDLQERIETEKAQLAKLKVHSWEKRLPRR